MTKRVSIHPGMVTGLIGLSVLALFATSASAQSCSLSWTEATSGAAPSARHTQAMAYDSERGVIVLFGGNAKDPLDNYMGDTWEWEGNSWTEKLPLLSPSARAMHAMAYDAANGVVVLFGGWDGGGFLDDTWLWNGTQWSQVCDQPRCDRPSARQSHKMVYDSVRGVVVLYGGHNAGITLGDTWEWNGATWTERFPAGSPSTRHVHAMSYDCSRGVVVLYGGALSSDGNTPALKDTWEYDGNNWTQKCSDCAPGPRIHHVMDYDGARGRSILFAGVDATNSCNQYSDTWAWDGSTWVLVAGSGSGPNIRTSTAMAFVGCRGRLVVFGGIHCTGMGFDAEMRSDTWSLGPCVADLDGDGLVGIIDFLLLLGEWGDSCQ